MSKGRILITGGSGMLGSYTAAQAAESGWETWATYSRHPVEMAGCRTIGLDVRDAARVSEVVAEARPEVIIHAAAMVKPDECEQQKDMASAVNALGTANIVSSAEKSGAHLIYVSTDLVFNGESNPYETDAEPAPLNHYGFTKLGAENTVRSSDVNWAVARTSIIYGPRKFPFFESFSDKVVEYLSTGKTLNAYTDQCRAPIPAWNLADVLLEIAERHLTGIYHAVCPEPSTRYEFACKVGEVFSLDTSLIKATSMDEVQTPARRPKTLILDTRSTQRLLNTRLLGYEEGILELHERML